MAEKKMIQIVSADSPKEEEIGALRAMAACAGQGSYLASLFSPEMVSWVEQVIRDDMSADLYGFWDHEVKQTADARAQVIRLGRELETERKDRDIALRECQQRWELSLAEVEKKLAASEKAAETWREEAARIRKEEIQASFRVSHLMEEVEAGNQEIVRLKAQLWDYKVALEGMEEALNKSKERIEQVREEAYNKLQEERAKNRQEEIVIEG